MGFPEEHYQGPELSKLAELREFAAGLKDADLGPTNYEIEWEQFLQLASDVFLQAAAIDYEAILFAMDDVEEVFNSTTISKDNIDTEIRLALSSALADSAKSDATVLELKADDNPMNVLDS